MKRIAHAVAVAALVFGAQAALAGENITLPSPSAEHAETYLNVAQMGAVDDRQVGAQAAQSTRKARNMLEELGLAGDGPFPSRGGPIDD